MAYRDDVIALSARHDALAGEVAAKTRELEASRQLLEQARNHAKLPVLDNIRVASPCTADWNQMTGDDRVRHCGQCRKNVYNLSGMTRDEAEALLQERNGGLCVRYYQRRDGTILLADCSIGRASRSHHRLIAAGAAGAIAAGLAAGVVASHLHGTEERLDRATTALLGDQRVVPPPSLLHQPVRLPPQEMTVTMGAISIDPAPPRPTPRPRRVKSVVQAQPAPSSED